MELSALKRGTVLCIQTIKECRKLVELRKLLKCTGLLILKYIKALKIKLLNIGDSQGTAYMLVKVFQECNFDSLQPMKDGFFKDTSTFLQPICL